MNPPAKAFLLLLTLLCSVPAWAGVGKIYSKENIPIRIGLPHFQAVSSRTLIEGNNAARYSIRNLFDHNKKTAWVTKFDQNDYDNNVATFEIDFDKPVYVQSITFQNGYQKSRGLFSANQRIKELEIRRIVTKKQAEVEADVTLSDTMAPQRITARQAWAQSANFFKTRKLLFFVYSIYPGTHYTDLCLSGLTIRYAKRIDYTPTRSWKELRTIIEQNKTKTLHGWDWLGFDNAKKYPKAFTDFLYYVLTGKDGAYALFHTFAPESTMRQEDLDNFLRDAVDESLSSHYP